jgi:hypothetical protein
MPGSTAYQWNSIVKPYPCRVTVHNCFLQPLQSVMQCLNLLDSAIETLLNYYNTHIAIWPTQWNKFENLPAAPTQFRLNTLVTTSLWNTPDIMILFSRTGDDYTIYQNSMYEKIILKLGNRNIPNFPLSSFGAIFLGMIYNASDFSDFELGMTAEFEDSLTRPRNDMRIIDDSFSRINMSTDCTSFLLNIQCERHSGGTYFDGLFGTNVTINLSGTSMFRGNNDSYFIPDLNELTLHSPSFDLLC